MIAQAFRAARQDKMQAFLNRIQQHQGRSAAWITRHFTRAIDRARLWRHFELRCTRVKIRQIECQRTAHLFQRNVCDKAILYTRRGASAERPLHRLPGRGYWWSAPDHADQYESARPAASAQILPV